MAYDASTGLYTYTGPAPIWLKCTRADNNIDYRVRAVDNGLLVLYENAENLGSFAVALRDAELSVWSPENVQAGGSIEINARYWGLAAITPDNGGAAMITWTYTAGGTTYEGSATMTYDYGFENYRYSWAETMPHVPDGENILVSYTVSARDNADCHDQYTDNTASGQFTFLPWQTMLTKGGHAAHVPQTENIRLTIWARYMFENEQAIHDQLNVSVKVSIDLGNDGTYDVENALMVYSVAGDRYEYENEFVKPGVDIPYMIYAQADNCEIQVGSGTVPDPVRSTVLNVIIAVDNAIPRLQDVLGASPPEIWPKTAQKLGVAREKLQEIADELREAWFWELDNEELQDLYVNLEQSAHKILVAWHQLEQFTQQGKITQEQLEAAGEILGYVTPLIDNAAGYVAEELAYRGANVPSVSFEGQGAPSTPIGQGGQVPDQGNQGNQIGQGSPKTPPGHGGQPLGQGNGSQGQGSPETPPGQGGQLPSQGDVQDQGNQGDQDNSNGQGQGPPQTPPGQGGDLPPQANGQGNTGGNQEHGPQDQTGGNHGKGNGK